MTQGPYIQCPKCGHEEQKVIQSRADNGRIHRRRECKKCKTRFSTRETIIPE